MYEISLRSQNSSSLLTPFAAKPYVFMAKKTAVTNVKFQKNFFVLFCAMTNKCTINWQIITHLSCCSCFVCYFFCFWCWSILASLFCCAKRLHSFSVTGFIFMYLLQIFACWDSIILIPCTVHLLLFCTVTNIRTINWQTCQLIVRMLVTVQNNTICRYMY